MKGKGPDLTKAPPRSPRITFAGFVIIARTIDKCRATLWGNVGEYHFDCPLDNTLFSFKGIKGEDFKKFVETGASDEDITEWVLKNGTAKSEAEIKAWSEKTAAEDYAAHPDKKAWLQGELAKLGAPQDATLFDYLELDDKASFKNK